jgi:hypothetical protein
MHGAKGVGKKFYDGFKFNNDPAEDAVNKTAEQFKDSIREETRKMLAQMRTGILHSPVFVQHVRELFKSACLDIAKEILAEEMPQLDDAVRVVIKEKWQAEVERAAHEILDAQLASMRKRLGVSS